MKTKLFFSVLGVFLVHGFGFAQSTFISLKTGNWNDPTTWNYTSTGVNDADGIPDYNDEVILTGDYTITANGDTYCNSLTCKNSTLNIISGTLSVTDKVVIAASNSENITASINGGRMECQSFDVGVEEISGPIIANYTTILKCAISIRTYFLTIYSSTYNDTYTNNATFSFESGFIDIGVQLKTINTNIGSTLPNPHIVSTSTFTTENNYLGRRALDLWSEDPFLLSETGISNIVLNGTKCEVGYAGVLDQNILNTEYYDLDLSSAGVKKFPDSPINIENTLTIHQNEHVVADLGSNVTHTTRFLNLGDTETPQLTGTYGGETSAASNINNFYFAYNTGILKVVGIPCTGSTKTWDGNSWTGGTQPTSTDQIIFAGDFNSSGDLFGCNCTVNSGNVTINTNNTLTLENEVTVNGGSLTFENDSNLIQKNYVSNTGIITYKRNSNALYKNDFAVWSSPVSGTTLHDISPNTIEDGYRVFNDEWISQNIGNSSPQVGIGFAIMAPKTFSDTTPTVFTAKFTGVPNNGDFLLPVLHYSWDPTITTWQLIGNPYPSAVSLKQFFNENNTSAIYFWVNSSKPNTTNTGENLYKYKSADYACYSTLGGVATDNGIVPETEYIKAGQGFFIVDYASYWPSYIYFKNYMRVTGNTSQFFKLSQKAEVEKSRLWLNLTNDEGLFKQILIGYVSGSGNFGEGSAPVFNNNKYANFYIAQDFENHFVIKGNTNSFADTDEFPLGFMVNLEKQPVVASQFTISISHTDGNFDRQPVYLYDKVNDSTNDLRKGGYTFSSMDGTFDDRFIIKFTNNSLGVNDFENSSKELIVAVKNKIISVNANSENIEKIDVYDISGKLIYSKNKIGNTNFEFPISKARGQVLLVKAKLETGVTSTKKVILN